VNVLIAAVVSGWLGIGFTWHSTPAERWIYVRQVAAGSPAALAGLAPQDVITHIDGKPVAFRNDVDAVQFFHRLRVGQTVTLRVLHNQKARTLRVTAIKPPDDAGARWRKNLAIARQRSG
jgi:S1-C subfamily serine protease